MMRLLILLALLMIGCRRNEDGQTSVDGTLPGACSTSVADIAGAVTPMTPGGGQSQIQTVSVASDVIDHPSDRVIVHLCKVADCNTTIPALDCSLAAPGVACSRTIPSPNIILGRNVVQFLNAGIGGAGFDTYNIHEEVCR